MKKDSHWAPLVSSQWTDGLKHENTPSPVFTWGRKKRTVSPPLPRAMKRSLACNEVEIPMLAAELPFFPGSRATLGSCGNDGRSGVEIMGALLEVSTLSSSCTLGNGEEDSSSSTVLSPIAKRHKRAHEALLPGERAWTTADQHGAVLQLEDPRVLAVPNGVADENGSKNILVSAVDEKSKRELAVRFIAWPAEYSDPWLIMEEVSMTRAMSSLRSMCVAPAFVSVEKIDFHDTHPLPTRGPWAGVGTHLLPPGRRGVTHPTVSIVTEHIGGGTMASFLRNHYEEHGFQDATAPLLSIFCQLEWTLAALQASKLVHLDIHPHNLLYYAGVSPAHGTSTSSTLAGMMHIQHDKEQHATWAHDMFVLTPQSTTESRASYRFMETPAGASPLPLLKLIDYGISQPRGRELDYLPTLLFYRPPEYILLADPQDPFAPNASATVCHEADLWSAAFSFVGILAGGLVPGLRKPSRGAHVIHHEMDEARAAPVAELQAFWDSCPMYKAPSAFLSDLDALVDGWQRGAKTQAQHDAVDYFHTEGVIFVGEQLWRLASLMGLPREANWPGIESKPVWKVLAKHAAVARLQNAPADRRTLGEGMKALVTGALDAFAPSMSSAERAALMSLLAQRLQWCPKYRPPAAQTLSRDPDFAVVAKRFAVPCAPGMPTTGGGCERPGASTTWALALTDDFTLRSSQLATVKGALRERFSGWLKRIANRRNAEEASKNRSGDGYDASSDDD